MANQENVPPNHGQEEHAGHVTLPDARNNWTGQVSDTVRWCGICSFGESIGLPNSEDKLHWSIPFKGDKIDLKPGFKSKRQVLTKNGDRIGVWCTVLQSLSDLP